MRQENESLHSTDAVWLVPTSPDIVRSAIVRSAPGDTPFLPLTWERPGPQLLLVMPAREERKAFSCRLSEAGYAVAICGTACEAIEYAEQAPVDGIVLDLDASYEAGARQAMISGFRLLELLWRVARTRPVALVVLTALDYAEIDDVLRRRVDALLNRSITSAQVLARLEAALARAARRWQSGGIVLATLPLHAAHADGDAGM
jgi:CheY-like chemotaxis protein